MISSVLWCASYFSPDVDSINLQSTQMKLASAPSQLNILKLSGHWIILITGSQHAREHFWTMNVRLQIAIQVLSAGSGAVVNFGTEDAVVFVNKPLLIKCLPSLNLAGTVSAAQIIEERCRKIPATIVQNESFLSHKPLLRKIILIEI